MQHDFGGRRVLIVEDDYLVATDLAQAFRAANAHVLGPFPNLSDAAASEANAEMAVLDVDLAGQMVFPLADRLMRADVPFVFYTGYDPSLLPIRFAEVGCLNKPLSPLATVNLLAQSCLGRPVRISDLVPRLRLHARNLLRDAHAADRLLERALRQAIDDPAPLPSIDKVGPWLEGVMDAIFTAQGGRLLH